MYLKYLDTDNLDLLGYMIQMEERVIQQLIQHNIQTTVY